MVHPIGKNYFMEQTICKVCGIDKSNKICNLCAHIIKHFHRYRLEKIIVYLKEKEYVRNERTKEIIKRVIE